jgi:hypothetical protein
MPYPHGAKGPCPPPVSAPYQGPLNHLVVIRGNVIRNNGGIAVRGHTTNCLVEKNCIGNSSVGVHVNTTHASHILTLNNTAGVSTCPEMRTGQ